MKRILFPGLGVGLVAIVVASCAGQSVAQANVNRRGGAVNAALHNWQAQAEQQETAAALAQSESDSFGDDSIAHGDDDDQSDAAIGERLAETIVEKEVKLPTSVQSAWQMGIEKATGIPTSVDSAAEAAARYAGASEAAAAVVGNAMTGVNFFFDATATAAEEDDSPYLWAQQARQDEQAAQARQFYLDHQAELIQNYHQSLVNLQPPPKGPEWKPCTQYCNK